MATTTNKASSEIMPIIRVSIFRSKSDPNTLAVSTDASGRVLPSPEDWEFLRSGTIETIAARAGSEAGRWLQAFDKDGYCLLKQDLAEQMRSDARSKRQA